MTAFHTLVQVLTPRESPDSKVGNSELSLWALLGLSPDWPKSFGEAWKTEELLFWSSQIPAAWSSIACFFKGLQGKGPGEAGDQNEELPTPPKKVHVGGQSAETMAGRPDGWTRHHFSLCAHRSRCRHGPRTQLQGGSKALSALAGLLGCFPG